MGTRTGLMGLLLALIAHDFGMGVGSSSIYVLAPGSKLCHRDRQARLGWPAQCTKWEGCRLKVSRVGSHDVTLKKTGGLLWAPNQEFFQMSRM